MKGFGLTALALISDCRAIVDHQCDRCAGPISVGDKVVPVQGEVWHRSCFFASEGTIRTWYRARPVKAKPASAVEQLQLAQDAASARLAAIHNALATGTDLPQDEATANPIVLERVNLRALQFQMERGGDRSWAEVQRLEHTGKDGVPLTAPVVEIIQLPELIDDGDADSVNESTDSRSSRARFLTAKGP